MKRKSNFPHTVYKEIQNGAVAKSRPPHTWLNICAFPHILGSPSNPHIWLCNCSILNFPIYEENFIFFFITVHINLCIYLLICSVVRYYWKSSQLPGSCLGRALVERSGAVKGGWAARGGSAQRYAASRRWSRREGQQRLRSFKGPKKTG